MMDDNAAPIDNGWFARQDTLYKATKPALNSLKEAQTTDVKGIAASQIELLSTFYDLSISQAGRSFRWALVASISGLLFFIAAIGFLLIQQMDVAIASTIGGAIVSFIAGVNFVLYGKTLEQLNLFQGRLENTQRFLLANSLCESLENGRLKDHTRAQLIGALIGVKAGGLPIEFPDPEGVSLTTNNATISPEQPLPVAPNSPAALAP